jgi:hypothetical protein
VWGWFIPFFLWKRVLRFILFYRHLLWRNLNNVNATFFTWNIVCAKRM